MAQLIYLVVDRAVLFDIGVGLGNVRLGLVVVVIRHEILNRIFRKELLELGAQLRREGFVVRENKRRAVETLDDVCHSKGLARTGHAEQGLLLVAGLNARNKLFNCLRLVACRFVFGMKLKIHSLYQIVFVKRDIFVVRYYKMVYQMYAYRL